MKNFDEILYMPEAEDFLCKLNADVRLKILYNISKAQYVKGPDLFKKIDEDIWEFGHEPESPLSLISILGSGDGCNCCLFACFCKEDSENTHG